MASKGRKTRKDKVICEEAKKRTWTDHNNGLYRYIVPNGWNQNLVTIKKRDDIEIVTRGPGYIWVKNPNPGKRITLQHPTLSDTQYESKPR